ncbi:MAG: hypothetical protein IJN70_05530 [Clostridia bacterium]|nr:hypothetical protein [Clostridia bacterium]
MKFTALFMAFILCFLAVLPVADVQAEAEEIQPRYLCDADSDGTVTAADARLILRFAVGIEYTDGFGWMNSLDALYCDADKSSAVAAADARIALRTAVGLEAPESRAFRVTDSALCLCDSDGYIRAECVLTGDTAYVNLGRVPHSFSSEEKCAGKGVCSECNQMLTFTPQHDFSTDPCRGTSRCIECNYTVYFEGHHKYSQSFRCSVCDTTLYYECNLSFCDFVMKNGEKIKDAAGRTFYVYEEADDYCVYGLLYNAETRELQSYCGMAVEAEGEVLYYDSYYLIYGKYLTVDCYTAESPLASFKARVDTEFVENGTEYGIEITEYQSIPELKGHEEEFEIVGGSLALMHFSWIRDFAQRIGFPDADLLYSENPAFW